MIRSACCLAVLLGSFSAVASADKPEQPTSYAERAFEAAQWAMLSAAGTAIQRLGVRIAAGSTESAGLVRQRQDLVSAILGRERYLAEAQATAQQDNVVRLRGEIDSLSAELAAIDLELEAAFPGYAELANPSPLSIAEVQALLEDDEALLVVFSGEQNVYTWAITRTGLNWSRSFYGAELAADLIRDLRLQLDPAEASRGVRPFGTNGASKIAPFDRRTAHALYRDLIGPVAGLLEGKRHVYVAADGPFAAIPFGIFVASEPPGADNDPEALQRTDWLIRHFALTTLPTVGTLRVVGSRPVAGEAPPTSIFVGFGAPVLGGRSLPVPYTTAVPVEFFRGGLADVDAVRSLPSLPETGPELRKLAGMLGAREGDLHLGPQATESALKQLDLSKVDVLAFATHGLLSGDMPGLAEPALVLTPPESASSRDDGLLTASEVAELNLSAKWVILSACNTAGSDGRPDGEGLSGLARAFLYAGARSILVSHWPVRDDAAAQLTTQAIAWTSGGKKIRRAEALREAMLAVMADDRDPSLAHPIAWAPFVIVGDGGR